MEVEAAVVETVEEQPVEAPEDAPEALAPEAPAEPEAPAAAEEGPAEGEEPKTAAPKRKRSEKPKATPATEGVASGRAKRERKQVGLGGAIGWRSAAGGLPAVDRHHRQHPVMEARQAEASPSAAAHPAGRVLRPAHLCLQGGAICGEAGAGPSAGG